MMDPPAKPAKPAKQKKQVAIKNALRLHTHKSPAASRKQCNNYFTKTYFLQNSWSCPQAYRGAGCRRKLPRDGATDFLAAIWQHITTVIFV